MFRRLARLFAWFALAVVVLFAIAITAGLLWGEQEPAEGDVSPTIQSATTSTTTKVPNELSTSECESAIASGTVATTRFNAAGSTLMPRIDEWRASEGEVALRRAELLVLVEETWLDMAESATLLDESYAQLVKTCAQEGKSVPSSVVSARREHLVARRELVATCLASRESAGVDLDLSWLTGDHDCAWIPLPSS